MKFLLKHPRIGSFYVFIDKEDYQKISSYKWRLHQGRRTIYVQAHNKKRKRGAPKQVKIGHVILGVKTNVIIDHRDSNGLNNRKRNLRIATPSQNGANRRKHTIGTSKFKGVTYKVKEKTYATRIRVNNKVIYGGGFNDEIFAAEAYNKLAIKYFKQFARLNIFTRAEERILKRGPLQKRTLIKSNNSGYVGVSVNTKQKYTRRFIATIYIDGKNKSLGSFDTAKKAAIAYNAASVKYKGKNAFQNKI